MSYLAQGLLSGFNQGFSAGTQAKHDKAMREERDAERAQRQKRQLLEDARYNDQLTRQQERQIVDDARWVKQQKIDADLRAEAAAQRQLDNDMRKTAYVDQRLDRTVDLSRQARQDFSTEMDKARLDPLKENLLQEQTRQLQLQNDNMGQARETLVYDPLDPTGAPKRTITGPLGTFDKLAPAAGADPTASLNAQDRVAYQWAKNNPGMPQAQQILQRLGFAQ